MYVFLPIYYEEYVVSDETYMRFWLVLSDNMRLISDWKPVPQGLVVTQRAGVGFVFPLLLLNCLSAAAPAKTLT